MASPEILELKEIATKATRARSTILASKVELTAETTSSTTSSKDKVKEVAKFLIRREIMALLLMKVRELMVSISDHLIRAIEVLVLLVITLTTENLGEMVSSAGHL